MQDTLAHCPAASCAKPGDASMIFLDASAVRDLLTIEECIAAVEQAFKLYGEGRAPSPGSLATHAEHGTFHTKAGTLDLGRRYFAAKTNANFPGNTERYGLPTIQGVIRSEEHTSELQSPCNLVCRLLLEKQISDLR